jgi:hypothetical protein
MIGPSAGTFRSTATAVIAYGIAMGYLEAAVVVYLRAAVGLTPAGLVPVHDPAAFGAFEGVEVARELATLVMIAAVGLLAGRSRLERLAWAAVAFGAWDMVYYLGLRLIIGWPPLPTAWDVLFLVPVPWVAPVWAPIAVSATLVGFGLAAARRLKAGRPIFVGPGIALANLVGGALVIASFLVDARRVLQGDSSAWTGWPLFWTGMALAIAVSATALGVVSRTRRVADARLNHGAGGRPSVGSPD